MNGNGALVNGSIPVNSCSTATSMVSRADLEAFKRELMSEFRREVQQLKNDVIEGLSHPSVIYLIPLSRFVDIRAKIVRINSSSYAYIHITVDRRRSAHCKII